MAQVVELSVLVSYAQGLTHGVGEWFGNQDPYVVLKCGKTTRRTRTAVQGGSNPVWNETLRFSVGSEERELQGTVKDECALMDATIGTVSIPLATALQRGSDQQQVVIRCKKGEIGVLHVSLAVGNTPMPGLAANGAPPIIYAGPPVLGPGGLPAAPPAQPQVYDMATGYAPPQQQYPQGYGGPPPGYGGPPPGYGGPPQGYGGPPQGYGGPPPGYGQPVPGYAMPPAAVGQPSSFAAPGYPPPQGGPPGYGPPASGYPPPQYGQPAGFPPGYPPGAAAAAYAQPGPSGYPGPSSSQGYPSIPEPTKGQGQGQDQGQGQGQGQAQPAPYIPQPDKAGAAGPSSSAGPSAGYPYPPPAAGTGYAYPPQGGYAGPAASAYPAAPAAAAAPGAGPAPGAAPAPAEREPLLGPGNNSLI